MTELPPHARRVDAIGPGTRLREWEVVRFVGSGSFGRVFEARRQSWVSGSENRALKVFDPILSAAARTNLVAEFATMREVRHPHLVAGYDAFDLDEGPFAGCVVFVIEMCDGDLASAIPRAAGGLPPADAAEVLADVAEGLAALHAGGRIHGDVKPENILRKGDLWKVGDFGVSGAIQGSYAMAAGITVDYRPPEFSQLDEGVRLHRSADIWAVGVTLHVACTGRHPFPGPDPFMRYAASLRGERQVVPELDPRIRELIDQRCMHPDARQRASATELAGELREVARRIRLDPFVPPPASARSGNEPASVVGPTHQVADLPPPPSPSPPPPPPGASGSPVAPPPASSIPPPATSIAPTGRTPASAPDEWSDATVPVAPTAESPYPSGQWPSSSPPPVPYPSGQWPSSSPPPVPFPPAPGAAPPGPARPDEATATATATKVGWQAVPVAVAATLAVAWLASLAVSLLPSDADLLAVRRGVYLGLSVVALGAGMVVARRRIQVASPWDRAAVIAAVLALVGATILLFR